MCVCRDLESFAEKGLSDKRKQLRYEHYEEKRQLKIKAIQNVLQKCHVAQMQANAGLPTSSEAMQVQALIEDLKRQSHNNVRGSQAFSSSPHRHTKSKWLTS